MKKIILKCGQAVTVDERILNDMEFLDCLAEADNDNPAALSMLVQRLLGKDQKKRVYNALRDKDGFVPAPEMSAVVVEIISAFGEAGKND